MNSDIDDFIKEKEGIHGGDMEYISYCRFLGEQASGNVVNLGGILYCINKEFYFEDFEKPGNPLLTYRRDIIYKKFNFQFSLKDITDIREISEKSGKILIKNPNREIEVVTLKNSLIKFFSTSVLEVRLSDRDNLILDITKQEEFITLCRNLGSF